MLAASRNTSARATSDRKTNGKANGRANRKAIQKSTREAAPPNSTDISLTQFKLFQQMFQTKMDAGLSRQRAARELHRRIKPFIDKFEDEMKSINSLEESQMATLNMVMQVVTDQEKEDGGEAPSLGFAALGS